MWDGELLWPTDELSRRQKRLMEMPAQREVRVRTGAVLMLNDSIQHEAALAYTRGTIADRWCKRCAAGDGNFPMCVVVEGELEGACSNYHFSRRKNKCSLHSSRKSYISSFCYFFSLLFYSFLLFLCLSLVEHVLSHLSTYALSHLSITFIYIDIYTNIL